MTNARALGHTAVQVRRQQSGSSFVQYKLKQSDDGVELVEIIGAVRRTLPSLSHKWVRNDAGKLLQLEIDESKRRLWDDLATVLLQGISYRHIETVLYERFGHVDERT